MPFPPAGSVHCTVAGTPQALSQKGSNVKMSTRAIVVPNSHKPGPRLGVYVIQRVGWYDRNFFECAIEAKGVDRIVQYSFWGCP